jgi:hypothetical protein
MSAVTAKTAYDWSRLYALFDTSEMVTGSYRPPATVFREMGEAVWDSVVLSQAHLLIRQVAVEADKHGIVPFLQYVFFVWFEGPKSWPEMPEADKKALLFAKRLLISAAKVPNYYDGLSVIPEDKDDLADLTLKSFAAWIRPGLRASMEAPYVATLSQYAQEASESLRLDRPDLQRVREAFETQALGNPEDMGPDGYDLWVAVKLLRG